MTLTNCSNILSTTQHHQKLAKQNICIRPMSQKSLPNKNKEVIEELKKKLQEIYQKRLNKVIDPSHRMMEQKLNKISESVFNPPEEILELFLQSVSQKSSSQALNMSNLPVFWELANAYQIIWLVEDCKEFMLKPTKGPEIGSLVEWLNDCK